jgi:thiosulfate dehydrogenase
MRKGALLVVLCLILLFAVSMAEEQKKEGEVSEAKTELKASYERGMELFKDASLGTAGTSCNSCHMEGGTKPGKMGDMEVKPFDKIGAHYPKYFEMAKKVMTLDQVVNICITDAMKGTALAWDDQRLADLVTYVSHVKPESGEKKDKPESGEKKDKPK